MCPVTSFFGGQLSTFSQYNLCASIAPLSSQLTQWICRQASLINVYGHTSGIHAAQVAEVAAVASAAAATGEEVPKFYTCNARKIASQELQSAPKILGTRVPEYESPAGSHK